jgi:cytochrome P450
VLVFNPLDPAFKADPHGTCHRFRAGSRVHRNPNGMWFLTRWRDVSALLGDRRAIKRPDIALKQFGRGPFREHNAFTMSFMDPPDHGRVRATVARWFTPRKLDELRPRIAEVAAELLDETSGASSIDLVQEYAYLLPVFVITEMLGVPRADREIFRRCSAPIVAGLEPDADGATFERADEAVAELTAYLGDLAEQRRRNPGGTDLLSAMVESEAAHKLAPLELIHNAAFLLNAGHETTTNLIANGIQCLLDFPDQHELLRRASDPAAIAIAIEEFLRFEPPLHFTFRRLAADYEIDGTVLPSGAGVMLGLAAANRDPEVFSDPDRLDIRRANAGHHVSFATGPHVCLGATLARYEGAIAIEAFLRRYPAFEPAAEPTRKTPATIFPGWASLPLRLA